jgi:hypothetical protein
MAKAGKDKNTKNKAKHSKLMNRKKNKLRNDKLSSAQRKKELIQKINAQLKTED